MQCDRESPFSLCIRVAFGLNGLRHQSHPQGRTHPADGVETRLRIRPQRLVQGFAGKPGRLGNFTHAARTGDVAQGRRQQRRIVRFQNVGQIGGDCRFAVESRRRVELKAGI